MTSISLHGAYEQTDEDYPAPKFGHPKDRRPDLKQIQAGLAVTGDGAIPVFHRAYDGNAGEVAQVVATMTALTKMATPRDFLLVGDSKLVSYANLAAMTDAGVAVPRTRVQDLRAGRCPGRAGHPRRHRGRPRRRTRPGQARRRAGPVAGHRGHHDR